MSEPSPPLPPTTTAASGERRQSVRSAGKNKTPLPRYTSIDLENEIPEMFNTSLNPNLHDPDMTMFFNRNAPPFHTNYSKRHSPPPSYSSRQKTGSTSSTWSTSTSSKPEVINRKRMVFIFLFFCIFLIIPLLFLMFFFVIPQAIALNKSMF
ncbi:unnamed protein product [Caenorhabditis bovis]|uniref:Uncharacterized protein n=1 Tax=Caenorhabditis bovis TaxID=2654633 RepID=A0A8S1EBT0_9PELO|nr:unnamed protein product [Caenorhabditis bovis]